MSRHIAVDLDGTLIFTDMLLENLFLFLRHYPTQIWRLFVWLFRGKAVLKRELAAAVMPAVVSLPYNQALLVWLTEQQRLGAHLILATASDARIARRVADHLGLFSEVMGTQDCNLSSHHKRAALVARFGERGFEYVGNSFDDLAVWKSAAIIHVANPDRGVLAAASNLGVIGEVFAQPHSHFRAFTRAMRMHQWAKNALIFVPLLASHRFLEGQIVWHGIVAFFAFGACASSVYLLNDLLDLPDDRQHPTKRDRPLAAGTYPILNAIVAMPVLLLAGFGLALWQLPTLFSVVLTGYYVLTLAYSLWLKRVVMLDVVTLAMLYTVRVIAGAAAMQLIATFWMLAFCMFIFLSLAFVKRYTELGTARQKGNSDKCVGRGYYPADYELLASLGGASGYMAVLVLALYINDAASGELYHSAQWLWAACPLLLFWVSRVWLLAHRGQMHDDPIVFALCDQVSRWIGLGFVAVFVMAAR